MNAMLSKLNEKISVKCMVIEIIGDAFAVGIGLIVAYSLKVILF